jgi:hypothetical protein
MDDSTFAFYDIDRESGSLSAAVAVWQKLRL